MAWTFSGTFLDSFTADRVTAGTGEPEELPGRFALAGLVDAHAHPTAATDSRGPYLADRRYGETRLAEYAASGVTVVRDAGGLSEVTLGFARGAADGHPVVTGTDVAGTVAGEIALLTGHGLTPAQAVPAAGSRAREFLGIHPGGDIVTYDADPLPDPGVLAQPAAVVGCSQGTAETGNRMILMVRMPRWLGRFHLGSGIWPHEDGLKCVLSPVSRPIMATGSAKSFVMPVS